MSSHIATIIYEPLYKVEYMNIIDPYILFKYKVSPNNDRMGQERWLEICIEQWNVGETR